MKCITAEIKNGKLFMKMNKTNKCKKKVQEAQEILDSIPTKKIIIR